MEKSLYIAPIFMQNKLYIEHSLDNLNTEESTWASEPWEWQKRAALKAVLSRNSRTSDHHP